MTSLSLLPLAKSLDNEIEKLDTMFRKQNLFEQSEYNIKDVKLEDVIQDEMEFEDGLSAEGIAWLLERNNRLVDHILILDKAYKNVLNGKRDAEQLKKLETLRWLKTNSEKVVASIDDVIDKLEKKLDENHSDCGCVEIDDVGSYSKMDPKELRNRIEKEGDKFWSRIGISYIEDNKKKLVLAWTKALSDL